MLSGVGVASQMERSFIVAQQEIPLEQAQGYISQHPQWILIDLPDEKPPELLRAADLATFLQGSKEGEGEEPLVEQEQKDEGTTAKIDLLKIPGERKQMAELNWRATMLEAQQELKNTGADALYISRHQSGSLDNRIAGIILPLQIDNFYRK